MFNPNLFNIGDSIKYNSNRTEIFIHTLLPINEKKFRNIRGFYPDHNYPINKQINEINRKIIDTGKNKGYKIMVEPKSIVYHVGGGTLQIGSPLKTHLNFRNNL